MRHVIAGITLISLLCLTAPALAKSSDDDMELFRIITVDQIDQMYGTTFEAYVCRLLESRGYSVENIRASNDFGVDAVASRDEEKIAIQIKRSKHPIDRRAISDASAGKDFYKCNKAMVITNSTLTESARTFAKEIGCVTVDRTELLAWIEEFKQATKRPSAEANE